MLGQTSPHAYRYADLARIAEAESACTSRSPLTKSSCTSWVAKTSELRLGMDSERDYSCDVGAPNRGVGGPVDVGVGTNDHGVLAPEFQAVGDQALRGRGSDASAGV